MQLEICAANLQSARAAARAGAHRIELCSALGAGGLTPSAGLIQAVVQAIDIPVHVLIRPREGHFVYSPEEVALMCADVAFCLDAGVHGVVVGALMTDGKADHVALQALAGSAKGMELTFHRAIDVSIHWFEILETITAIGFNRVLSSGGAATAWDGRFRLQEMVKLFGDRITIMPGGGITPGNIRALALETGAVHFHLSAKSPVKTEAHSLPGLAAGYEVSSEMLILQTLEALMDQNDRLMA
jgi:copper homeostasis protein